MYPLFKLMPKPNRFGLFVVGVLYAASGDVLSRTLVFQSDGGNSPERVMQTETETVSSDPSSPVSQSGPTSLDTQQNIDSSLNSANSELFFMFEQLQQEVRVLRGALEEQANQIHHLTKNAKSRYRDLDARVLGLSKQVSKLKSPEKPLGVVSGGTSKLVSVTAEGVVEGSGESTQAVTVTKVVDAPELQPPTEEQKRQYHEAYALIKEKKFDDAILRLQSFIAKYPEGSLTGNAYYWLGEVYLVLPQLEQAKQAFSIVVNGFPTHRKLPDALYKLGVCYDRLQDSSTSEKYLNDVQAKFPNSTAAKLAKNYKINR